MPTRICSNCRNYLGSNDYYFCSSCGNALDSNLIQPLDIVRVTTYVPQETFQSKYLKKAINWVKKIVVEKESQKILFLILSVVAVILYTFLVVAFLNKFPGVGDKLMGTNRKTTDVREEASETTTPRPNVVSISLLKSTNSGTFGSENILSFVPKDADIFVECFCLKESVQSLLETSPHYPLVKQLEPGLQEHFALFGINTEEGWEGGGVFIPKDVEEVEKIVEEIELEEAYFEIINGKLIVATKEDIIREVEYSSNGETLSLAQSPLFVSATVGLPKEGLGMLLLLTDDGKEMLNFVGETTVVGGLKTLVEELSKSGYNELIIK